MDKITNKQIIDTLEKIYYCLESNNKDPHESIYIIWDNANLPSIKSTIQTVWENFDDVAAVSFDTWLYCPTEGWVIEFYHDGDITLGFEEKEQKK